MNALSTNDRPVVVFQVNEPLRAEMVKASLEAAGIDTQLTNGNQGSFAGVDLVPVELVVKAEDAERTPTVIAVHEHLNDV
tara:strand:- start:1645 stop:1884 length:240 start_codon:yes stop_codon:yes gene_type:complete